MRSTWLVVGLLGALAWAGLAPGAAAESGDRIVRFGIHQSIPTDDLEEPDEVLELDEAVGVHGSFEYMLTPLIGIEPSVSLATHDVEVTTTGVGEETLGELELLTLAGTVNFHLVRREAYSIHLGPTVGIAIWGDLETDLFLEDVSVDNELLFGANAGIDVPFGASDWGFAGGIDYWVLDATAEGTPPPFDELGVDPFRIRAGVSFSF